MQARLDSVIVFRFGLLYFAFLICSFPLLAILALALALALALKRLLMHHNVVSSSARKFLSLLCGSDQSPSDPTSDPFRPTFGPTFRPPSQRIPMRGARFKTSSEDLRTHLRTLRTLWTHLLTLSDPHSDPPSDLLRSESLGGVQDLGLLPKTFGPTFGPFGPTFGPLPARIPIRGALFWTFGPRPRLDL